MATNKDNMSSRAARNCVICQSTSHHLLIVPYSEQMKGKYSTKVDIANGGGSQHPLHVYRLFFL